LAVVLVLAAGYSLQLFLSKFDHGHVSSSLLWTMFGLPRAQCL
jgi:hypothetical protein